MENQEIAKILFIKNMVCLRCLLTVEGIFKESNIPVNRISLGQVQTSYHLSELEMADIEKKLNRVGLELLASRDEKLIEHIKHRVRQFIHLPSGTTRPKLSEFIAENLYYDYSYLSDLFSSAEGMTIEKFFIFQRMERVKELICYDEHSLTEIAFLTGFSSIHHLSRQFKKINGMTPSQYRESGLVNRVFLDKSS